MQLSRCGAADDRKLVGRLTFTWLATLAIAVPAIFAATLPAAALSEIKREELPAPAAPQNDEAPEKSVPLPDPLQTTPPADATPNEATPEDVAPETDEPEQVEPGQPAEPNGAIQGAEDPDAPLPEIQYDVEKLPEPVRRMRQLILDAAKTGDIEKLRPLIGTGDDATQLSLTEVEGDTIDFLRGLSGDTDGQEILAILEEVLNSGYVHLEAGTPQEIYAWPYFFAIPLDRLTSPQRVELFKIVTAGDYEDMKTYGTYTFYRAGIAPDGQWVFFVAGE
jgi:hypothetical protein